ncbi:MULTISPECIES: TnpV protein [Lachnospiraceae]|uniref:TnpV protein n=1 Tax=Blautia massiliensis (ex Durand et al. 2017) TaxID=1737424 RepID=UPI002ED2084E
MRSMSSQSFAHWMQHLMFLPVLGLWKIISWKRQNALQGITGRKTAGRSVTSLQIPIWKDMMNSTSELPLRELPLSASHIPSLPGRWAMQMTILSTRIFWTSLILIRRLPPMCWELRSAKCPARSSGKLNARSEPMKEISRQKGAKTMMELNYTKNGDYLIPDIQLSVQEQKPLGKYGRMRRAFLQENNTLLYNHLILTEKLYPHLWEIQETATARMEQMMADLLKANPAPDKKLNQMAWVQHMNMLKAQAEEVILTELINS